MDLKQSWKRAWNMGRELSEKYSDEESALRDMDMDTLADFQRHGFPEFFHAGFIGREPEWVEAIRYGEIPEDDYSINWADHTAEPGVSCVKIIRSADDENYASIYDVTCCDREMIRVAGWWLGLSGSDGEPTLLGVVKVSE